MKLLQNEAIGWPDQYKKELYKENKKFLNTLKN